MLRKVAKFFSQTVRYLRSSATSTDAKHRRSRSPALSEASSHLSDLSFESARSESTCASVCGSPKSDGKMSKEPSKFDQMCKAFEMRLQQSRASKEKLGIKSGPVDETISIDDDVMLVEASSPAKSKPKKKEVQLFGNVTSKLQNVPLKNDEICLIDDENCLKVNAKISNGDLNVQPPPKQTAISDEELSAQERFDEELKKSTKSLKPENYRIQQVIKAEDLVYFDLETGGMGYKEDILQIGALNHEGKSLTVGDR